MPTEQVFEDPINPLPLPSSLYCMVMPLSRSSVAAFERLSQRLKDCTSASETVTGCYPSQDHILPVVYIVS